MPWDNLERRCPRLGSMVTFGYCRACEGDERPCFKVLDCWWEQFDVVHYFQERLASEAFERLSRPQPPNKVASLVDLIRAAQARVKSE